MSPKVNKLIKYLKELGWVLARHKNHLVFNKKNDILVVSGTPSDYRAMTNIKLLVKRKERRHAK